MMMLACIEYVGHHLSHDNMEYALQMELWKGNITGVIQLAREGAQLSDWIVSLAPLASYETWEKLCEEYAKQLEEEGQYHKAVSYLLVSHKLYPAIDLFRRHKLFREAVALAHVRLSLLDPVWEDLYTDWSEQLMRDGAYEQAAKCYLAMKRIQDAAQAITRRNDQSSLKTACHMTLVANEKQQGQLYAQQVVTRFLLNCQWAQCLDFLREHQPLKVFIPYVSVHEMLMRELTSLLPSFTPGAADYQTAVTWDSAASEKLGLPEFILDPKEADPVLPWEAYLVSGRTFPHHVLRVWYLCLGVTMETEELHLVYHALQQLQSGRQAHLDTQQVLLQVCADITLWLLALLTNQTSLAISHLLGAMSALHEGGHHHLLTALCRLLLPQGPKYTLKLQQEATALRVLINMESQGGDVEGGGGGGGGKHLSLRRYLSELKDEPSVSTGALRCKQLDCVRAYYYLSVLHYLQQAYHRSSQDACRPESSAVSVSVTPTSTTVPVSGSSEGVESASPSLSAVKVLLQTESSVARQTETDAGKKEIQVVTSGGGGGDDDGGTTSAAAVVVSGGGGGDDDCGTTTTTTTTATAVCGKEGSGGVGKDGDLGGSSVDLPQLASDGGDDREASSLTTAKSSGKKSDTGDSCVDLTSATAKDSSASSPDSGDGKKKTEGGGREGGGEEEKGGGGGGGSSEAGGGGGGGLSKGLLWDVQAKRLALTDTLGYIHQAISHHLLTDRSREVARTLSRHPHAGNNHLGHKHHQHHHAHHQHHQEVDNTTSSFAPVLADTVATHLSAHPLMDIDDVGGAHPQQPPPPQQPPSSPYPEGGGASPGGEAGVVVSPVSQSGDVGAVLSSPLPSVSPRSLSPSHANTTTTAPSPSRDAGKRGAERSGGSSSDQGLVDTLPGGDSNFDLDLVTLGQQWDGSRRVLWQDDPVSGSSGGRGVEGRCWGSSVVGSGDSSVHKPTSLLSPGKYINVPDEWYSLPVDEKYGRSYVTLAILKDEQDFVMGELKRMSDSSQVPFPNPFQSVETLLAVCLVSDSSLLPAVDKHNYVKTLLSWAMHFSVTARQRAKTDALFASAEKDIGL
ncbi:hypothetical protein ACOMHN_029894 [Nucella lapillus]